MNCEILLTASMDCTVRLWTIEGNFVGRCRCVLVHLWPGDFMCATIMDYKPERPVGFK